MHATSDRPSAAVYRRRRLVALLALVAVVLLGWWVVSRVTGGPSDEESGSPTVSEAPPATDHTAEPDASATEPNEEHTPSAEPTPSTPATPPVCTGNDVKVTAIVDAESYAADAKPKLSLKLRNTGANPCVMDVGTSAQEFTIKSGEDVIWVSTHCQKNAKPQVVQLDPGKEVTSPQLEWVRERSTPDTCDGERPAAVGGGAYYSLTVSVAGITSEPVYFSLA
nr:hypothetical protein [Pseudoclavibacter sp. Marseille-Q3772]